MQNIEEIKMINATMLKIDTMLASIEEVIANFRMQKENIALSGLVNIIDAFATSMNDLFIIENILKKYQIRIERDRINNLFKEMIHALENRDYILIGDILEYEILEWYENVKQDVQAIL